MRSLPVLTVGCGGQCPQTPGEGDVRRVVEMVLAPEEDDLVPQDRLAHALDGRVVEVGREVVLELE
jgi:hypothetical protein